MRSARTKQATGKVASGAYGSIGTLRVSLDHLGLRSRRAHRVAVIQGERRGSAEVAACGEVASAGRQPAQTAALRGACAWRGGLRSGRGAGVPTKATIRSSIQAEAWRVVRLWSESGTISTLTFG